MSPRQGVRFETSSGGLELYLADGRKFLTYLELADLAAAEQARADAEADLADAEARRADLESKRAAAANEHASAAAQRAEKLAARLRALGIDPEESI